MQATAAIYADLQPMAGKTLQEISGLDLGARELVEVEA
jgi:hypothetical protein